MHVLHTLLRFFPFWALPMAFILGEVGRFHRRKQHRAQHIFWAASGMLIVLSLLWFFFRGDINSDRWIPKLRR